MRADEGRDGLITMCTSGGASAAVVARVTKARALPCDGDIF